MINRLSEIEVGTKLRQYFYLASSIVIDFWGDSMRQIKRRGRGKCCLEGQSRLLKRKVRHFHGKA